MSCDVFYSPHDRGWYAEVWLRETGEQVYETPLCQSMAEAKAAAFRWAQQRETSSGE